MYNRIYKFFSCNDFIYPLQFGFRKVYSTVHTLISLSESIRKNLDEGNIGCSNFFFFFFIYMKDLMLLNMIFFYQSLNIMECVDE